MDKIINNTQYKFLVSTDSDGALDTSLYHLERKIYELQGTELDAELTLEMTKDVFNTIIKSFRGGCNANLADFTLFGVPVQFTLRQPNYSGISMILLNVTRMSRSAYVKESVKHSSYFRTKDPLTTTWSSDNISKRVEEKLDMSRLEKSIKKVIFNDPATIILWNDGTKTVVHCNGEDKFDKEKGMAMAIAKRLMGNKGNFNELFKKYIQED